MSVLVFAEIQDGSFRKVAYEAVTYGRKTADLLGVACHALVVGAEIPADAGKLGLFGAAKVFGVSHENLKDFDSKVYAQLIADATQQLGAQVVVLPFSIRGKALGGRIAARLNAASVSGVNSLPDVADGFRVKKPVFSGKAIATVSLNADVKVISLMGNSLAPEEGLGTEVSVESLALTPENTSLRVLEVKKQEGGVPLPEAELVVSGGRGLKGPENWHLIEDLAKALGAATACSRPVADNGWRPHHEHVGQTGLAIRPNLYIAIGISGAIQHLAGVNNSKTIVVINKDPEAPFFKAADYGVVGDLFEVVPRLTEAIRRFKQ